MLWSVLVLCALGVVTGAPGLNKTGVSPIGNRHRRSPAELFFRIVADHSNKEWQNSGNGNANSPGLPTQLGNVVWNLALGNIGHQLESQQQSHHSQHQSHHESGKWEIGNPKGSAHVVILAPVINIPGHHGGYNISLGTDDKVFTSGNTKTFTSGSQQLSSSSVFTLPASQSQQLTSSSVTSLNAPISLNAASAHTHKTGYSYETPKQSGYSYAVPQQPAYSYETPKQSGYSYDTPKQSGYSYAVPQQGYSYAAPQQPEYNFESRFAEPAQDDFIPFSDGYQLFQTSAEMVESYRRQRSIAPDLPVIIVPELQIPNRIPVPNPVVNVNVPVPQNIPPRPDFNRSLRLRVDLTATTADYTEAYDIQWDTASNTARMFVEDGSTIFYRTPLADGRVQYLEVRQDRSDGRLVRRCMLSPLMPASRADRSFPGLPVMDKFVFAGYTSAEGRPLVERWQMVVTARPGQGGAAQGESLTFNHEMLVTRDGAQAVPLKYSVVTDSSLVGTAIDFYSHRYVVLPPSTFPLQPDFSRECNVFDDFPTEDKEPQEQFFARVVSRFDPIREFAGEMRDTKYDFMLDKFKNEFKRQYLDPAEEAVRKNLFVSSSRFIAASNRLASTFVLAANFLSDRLVDEISQLFGVIPPPDGAFEPGLLPFPYSDNEVTDISDKLEDEFDWRPLGAVSPVRFQGVKCASCWAFAVAGSTEGALFKKTKKLVPLSPQCLVDCAQPYGAHGCDGTWPSFGYDYVQDRGLPAWDDYKYEEKVVQCRDRNYSPVTHISGHVNVTANNEAALKVAIKNHAPNVVVVDAMAQSFIFYKSGVLKDTRCGSNKKILPGGGIAGLNHAVLAVGWGKKNGNHFILKNTWTEKWGEAGYIRMSPDSCAVMDRPSYPLIKEFNIDREDLRAAAARANEV